MDVPGLAPPVIDPQETVDELHIIPRPDDLALYGISRRQVARFVETAMKGEPDLGCLLLNIFLNSTAKTLPCGVPLGLELNLLLG